MADYGILWTIRGKDWLYGDEGTVWIYTETEPKFMGALKPGLDGQRGGADTTFD